MLSSYLQKRLFNIVEQFLNQLSCSNYSPQTIVGYRYDLNHLISLLGRISRPITSIKQALSEQHLMDTVSLRYKDNPNITAFAIRRYVCAYRSLIKHLIQQQMLPPHFGQFHFELPKLPQILPKALPDPLLRSLLSYPSSNKWLDIRNLCMFELMAFSGLRIGEVIRLRLTDICLSTRQIKVFGKGSIERFVPISEKSAKHMAHYISLTNPYRISNNLFITQTGKPIHHSTVRHALRQQAQNAGITQHITPHSLRHSCATHFVKQTKDLRFVQLLLGHRNISTTQIYVHLDHEYMAKTFDEHCMKIEN